ncbi:proton channel OtopLc-like [Lineus longissimus]|uniref:proton channel OtopLc-like n=1 Tax=Lineus longissimus TaxID=88925 RepID=UPI00315D9DBA
MKVNAKSLVVDTLCKLYALWLIVIGLLIPITNIVTDGEAAMLTSTMLDVFQVILAGTGIAFFLFMHGFIVRGVTHLNESELREADEAEDDIETRRISRGSQGTISLGTMNTSLTTLQVPPEYARNIDGGQYSQQNGDNPLVQDIQIGDATYDHCSVSTVDHSSKGKNGDGPLGRDGYQRAIVESQRSEKNTAPIATILGHGEGQYPNFYVRVGAVLFGIGTLVTYGIGIFSIAEVSLKCHVIVSPLDVSKWILQGTFTSLQLYFIFKYSKISVNRWKVLVRFGTMHLLATNINWWIQTIALELEEVLEMGHGRSLRSSTGRIQLINNDTVNYTDPEVPLVVTCVNSIPGATLMRNTRHFLYPLIIEFSLIGAVCFYNIYGNIGLLEKIRRKRRQIRTKSIVSSMVLHFPHHQAVNITCHKSFKGAFLGVIMVAMTVISCVVYNVHQDPEHVVFAGAVYNFTDIAILFPSILAVSWALFKMPLLSILQNYQAGPDEILLMIAVVGSYTYDTYSIYVYMSKSQLETWMKVAGALCAFLSLIQSTLQVMFLFDGLRRQTATTVVLRSKPGREAVVLLLLLNLALWMLYSFSTAGGLYQVLSVVNPAQSNESMIVSKLCKPLAIFFRFHSTTCLYEIWKNSYTLHKSETD